MKYLILFAGAVGSSKTPIATYLSWNLGLPIWNTDAIRSEVIEDLGELDPERHQHLRDERLQAALLNDHSLIADVSIDRIWKDYSSSPILDDYTTFIISLDLSRELLERLYIAKGYTESLKRIDALVQDHTDFLDQFSSQVDLAITDETFPNRLDLCLDAVQTWMNS